MTEEVVWLTSLTNVVSISQLLVCISYHCITGLYRGEIVKYWLFYAFRMMSLMKTLIVESVSSGDIKKRCHTIVFGGLIVEYFK